MSDARRADLEYAHQVIVTAEEILRQDGWIKGHYGNEAGEHCVLGAVSAAHTKIGKPTRYTTFAVDPVYTAIQDSLPQRAARWDNSIAAYNDDSRTTFVSVMRLLGRARRLLKKTAEGAR